MVSHNTVVVLSFLNNLKYLFLASSSLTHSFSEMIEAMENNSRDFELPAGFRFHPTDEELITHYLSQKVLDGSFSANAIGEADLNKCEPWDLPWMAKMGENEWYFFCVRDRKYPTGLRTNRATGAGYWKATGKDKEIYREKILIGMKKTLVFYKGRAPKGEKTNWVMHEYRLEDKHSMNNLHKRAMNEWAICRVFEKGSCGQKMQVIGMERHNSFGKELPPLMDDSSPQNMSETKASIMESSHVTCYSDPNLTDDNNNIVDSMLTSSYSSNISPASWSTFAPHVDNSLSSDCLMVQEQSMLRMLIENHGSSTNHIYQKAQESDFDADISSATYNNEMFQRSFGNVDNGCLWNF